MVIGRLQREQESGESSQVATSAWGQVEQAQRQVLLPCLLVPQPAHAVLAGEIAAGLLADCFGELPPEIKRAIQMHDTGWAASDAQQIQRLRSGGPQASKERPVSFLATSPEEATEAWTASIDTVEAFSKTGAIIISRHFILLAQHDQPAHQRFLVAEKLRQQKLAGAARGADLDRWTAALGFCDLVSLYLLTALSSEVEFPLAHPSLPQAKAAPHVRMRIEGNKLRFTPGTIRPGWALSVQALKHPVPAQGPRAETLSWEVQ